MAQSLRKGVKEEGEEAPLAKITLPCGMEAQFLTGPRVKITHPKTEGHVSSEGVVLPGHFGTGTWQHGKVKEEQNAKDTEITYMLRDANSMVLFDGVALPVGELIEKKL